MTKMVNQWRPRLVIGIAMVFGLFGTEQTIAAPEKFVFDKAHTEIIFNYSHVGNSTAYGQFNDFDGEIVIDTDEPANSRVDVTIKTASVDTGVVKFDEHLRSSDFFNTDKYPEMRFVSKSVTPAGKTSYRIVGELTIKAQTRPVTLIANLNFKGDHPLGRLLKNYKGVHVAGFSASTQVFRSEFGLGLFAPLTSDHVNIIIETELFRQEG